MKRKIKKHPTAIFYPEVIDIDTSRFKGDYAFYALEDNLLELPEVLEKFLVRELKTLQPKRIEDYAHSSTLEKVCADLQIPYQEISLA